MATPIMRSGLRSALQGGACGTRVSPSSKRSFTSSPPHHEEAGMATCTIFSIYNLSKPHPHHEEPPPYQYLHVRSKEFPWGPDGLFEVKRH